MTGSVDTRAILRDGRFFILDHYAMRDEIYRKVEQAFLAGIESIEGGRCRERVAAAGLARLHEHFPVEKILVLESYLHQKLRDDLYYWSFRVGREDLGLAGTFYVDHLIVMRIHYPFLLARQAKNVQVPAPQLSEKLRLGAAALKNWRMLINAFHKARQKKHATSAYDPEAYHRKLPIPARAHGAHVDTWYGHSYDGINLWWAIDGVNQDNTVILYPELFGHLLPFDPVSMYLAEGVALTRPDKALHGTQVNISDETRIVISTRLNPETPRFDVNAAWHLEHWLSSKDLERRKFSSVTVFPAKKYQGEPSFAIKSEPPARPTPRLRCAGRLSHDAPQPVCDADQLPSGDKLAVDLDNAKVFVYRDGQTLRAFNRICPHLGMDMVGGYHDREQIFCPGHGIAYSLADGSSRCPAFRLRQYDAFERGGKIYLQQRGPAEREAAGAPALEEPSSGP